MPHEDAPTAPSLPTPNSDTPTGVSTPTQSTGHARLLWFLLIPFALCICALLVWRTRSQSHKLLVATTSSSVAEPVTSLQPQAGDLTSDLVLPATLQPFTEAPIYARVNGYVEHWYANIGQRVTAGEVLARIDSPEINQGLIRARAALNQADSNLKLAGVTTSRYRDLVQSDSVAQQEVDQNNQNLVSQRASVESTTADVKLLEQQQGYEAVTAPFTGVITERLTDVGSLINSGNGGTGSELFRLSRIDIMRIFVSLPEAYSQQVTPGMTVSVQLTELPNQTFSGKVSRSNRAIDLNTRTLLVEIDVPNPQGKLLPGAYGQVHFKLSSPVRPLMIPSGSILFQAAGPQVALITPKNTVELRKVVIGRDLGNVVEITDGLSTQDTIISSPPDYLVNGMPVTVQGHASMQLPKQGN